MLRFFLICFFVALGTIANAGAPVVVKVGGYAFPPFVYTDADGSSGVTIDLINELNRFQNKYRFDFFLTSPKRRYHAFKKGHYDIIFFENILWGWKQASVDVSKIFLTGGEVYITKASPGKDQSYFSNLASKSKAGILGYHYGFANFNASPEYLWRTHQMTLYTDHKLVIDKVITGQVDIAVVSASFLSHYLKENPSNVSRLLISEKYDQIYRHTALGRKDIKLDVNEINKLIEDMDNSGILDKIWNKYGIRKDANPGVTTGKLTIGVSFAIPPYVIKETGQGIELEILRESFSVTGYDIEIKYLPLARTFTQLETGKIDGVINIKKGMLDHVFYSDEVITFQNCAISLAKKGYPDFKDLSFLKEKYVIAFQRAPTILGEEFARITIDHKKYEEVAEQDQQVMRLFLDRSADVIVMEKKIFNYYRKKALQNKIIGDKAKLPVKFHILFPPTRYRFAFREKAARDAFNYGLKTIQDNNKYDRIIQKYESLMSLD